MQLLKADSTVQPCAFDWELVQTSDKKLTFKITFEVPEGISANPSAGKDRLKILFKDASQFINCPNLPKVEGRLLAGMPKDYIIYIALPSMKSTWATTATDKVI